LTSISDDFLALCNLSCRGELSPGPVILWLSFATNCMPNMTKTWVQREEGKMSMGPTDGIGCYNTCTSIEFQAKPSQAKNKNHTILHRLWCLVSYAQQCQLPYFESQTRSHLHSARPCPFPCLLHCLVYLPTPVWEFLLVGIQCDNTRSKL
jgi:hypothetical protein